MPDDDLIQRLKLKVKEVDEQIKILKNQRQVAINMICSLDEKAFQTPPLTRSKRQNTIRAKILEEISNLIVANQRPVSLKEIMEHLDKCGIQKHRSFIGAVLSSEVNSTHTAFTRKGWGIYDLLHPTTNVSEPTPASTSPQ